MRIDEINKANAILGEVQNKEANLARSLRNTAIGVYTVNNEVKITGITTAVATEHVAILNSVVREQGLNYKEPNQRVVRVGFRA